jgi:hypothetical protein
LCWCMHEWDYIVELFSNIIYSISVEFINKLDVPKSKILHLIIVISMIWFILYEKFCLGSLKPSSVNEYFKSETKLII